MTKNVELSLALKNQIGDSRKIDPPRKNIALTQRLGPGRGAGRGAGPARPAAASNAAQTAAMHERMGALQSEDAGMRTALQRIEAAVAGLGAPLPAPEGGE